MMAVKEEEGLEGVAATGLSGKRERPGGSQERGALIGAVFFFMGDGLCPAGPCLVVPTRIAA